MQFLIFFTLPVLFFDGANTYNCSSLTPRMTNLLQELCPGVNICHENKTSEGPPKTFMPGFVSCCSECSCRPECQADKNCCYPENMPMLPTDYRAAHTKFECLFPSTPQPNPDERYLFRSYYMISSVLNESVYPINSATNISCGEEEVAPWGSLQPVYSAKRKQIYKNIACANADGVDDGKLWAAKLHCRNDFNDDLGVDVTTYLLALESYSMHEHCQVYFLFEGDTEVIRPQQCYTDLVDKCNTTDFQVPGRIEATKEEVIEACTSGLLSPYRHINMFANVFCLICNIPEMYGNGICPVYTGERGRATGLIGFISLIDGNFIKENHRHPQHIPADQKACPIKDSKTRQNVCRRVHCPTGQLYDQCGRCKYPSKRWLNQEYVLYISLTSEQNFSINELFQHQQVVSFERVLDLKSPWEKNWVINSIYYEDTGKGNMTTNLLVVLTNKLSEVNPEKLMKYIKNTVKCDWILKLQNETITLRSRVLKHEKCALNSEVEKEIVIGNQSVTVPFPSYNKVYNTLSLIGNIHLVTKLYWCEQVELQPSEFILNSDKSLLFNLISYRILHCGEFVLIASNTFEGIRVRVCIEDSGFYSTDDQVSSFGGSRCKIYSYQWLLVFLYICCVNHIIQTAARYRVQ